MKSRIITSTNQLSMDSSTTNAWVELIPGMDKLVGYMKAQDNKIKQLQDKNKELKEQNEKLQEQNEDTLASLNFYQECNEELKEEIKELKKGATQKVPDGVMSAFRGLTSSWWEDELRYYSENFDIKEKYHNNPEEIPTKYLSDCNYTDLRILDDWLSKGKYEKYEWEIPDDEEDESEEESEEETDKYDGDEWRWVYGKNIIEQEEYKEVVLIMAGGGDHWENWTMTPTMNYIVNKDGKHPQHGKVLVQSSCGNYVSFQDKDYVPDDGECICEYEHCVV
jgi:hypothetical protein